MTEMRFPALLVKQPIGEFYICSIPFYILEKVAFPDPLTIQKYGEELTGKFELTGNQREEVRERRRAIGNFISSAEATFPNSIILAANVNADGSIREDDYSWRIEYDESCSSYQVVIPDINAPLARIIDGQHRVRGFAYSEHRPHSFDLPCSIFLDLSMPEQASIFATININQKRVDKSLAYNLFAYNLDDEPQSAWSPDKLAVFLTRRLGIEKNSPLKGHIKVVARQGRKVYEQDDWHVSTSVFVDGISALFSKRPQEDRDRLRRFDKEKRNRKHALLDVIDDSPLRNYYLDGNDLFIYTTIFNFFDAAYELVLQHNETRGFMTKSIGIQALLEFLGAVVTRALDSKDISKDFFVKYFEHVKHVDFNNANVPANAQGKSLLRNFLLYANDLPTKREIKMADKDIFDALLRR